MFRRVSRNQTRQTHYFSGTNYTSRPVYQYGAGLEILDEMPRFIPREDIQDIFNIFQIQIDKIKENSTLLETVVYSTIMKNG
jgi:hypothetical protein